MSIPDTDMFLRALWGEVPSHAAVQLWRKSDKTTHCRNTVQSAVDWMFGHGDTDCYVAVGLAIRNGNKPTKTRANAEEVVGIPGVWADIDVNGGPEGKGGAARDLEAAQSLAESLLQPTVVVNSGYGLQAWWLFKDGPWVFADEAERHDAQRLVQSFQGGLKAEAARRGYTIDSTHDLARLMRVPGGFNHKGAEPVPVQLLDDGGPRYPREEIERVGVAVPDSPTAGSAPSIVVRPDAQPPESKLALLLDVDDDFRAHWNHKPTAKSMDWSMSEYEFSFINAFVRAGWEDQEICDALVWHRNRFEKGDPKGKNRVERLAQSIANVRADTDVDEEPVLVDASRKREGTTTTEDVAQRKARKYLRKRLKHVQSGKAVTVVALVQRSEDTNTVFELDLGQGRRAVIGSASALNSHTSFRAALTPEHIVVRHGRTEHPRVVEAMLQLVRKEKGVTAKDITRGWISSFSRGFDEFATLDAEDTREAVCNNDAWASLKGFRTQDDGRLWIYLDEFEDHVRNYLRQQIGRGTLAGRLRKLDFDNCRVQETRHNREQKIARRSYWFSPPNFDLDQGDDEDVK